MNTRLPFKTQGVIGWGITAAVCLSFAAAILTVAETNETERAMVTDSDGDGMTDWHEWQAGTNPGDFSNCFQISSVKIENSKIILNWQSVGTSAYEVVSSATVAGLATNPQHVVFFEATGGIAPWYEVLSTATNNLTGSNLFFRIHLVVPQNFEQSTLDMATFE